MMFLLENAQESKDQVCFRIFIIKNRAYFNLGGCYVMCMIFWSLYITGSHPSMQVECIIREAIAHPSLKTINHVCNSVLFPKMLNWRVSGLNIFIFGCLPWDSYCICELEILTLFLIALSRSLTEFPLYVRNFLRSVRRERVYIRYTELYTYRSYITL